MKEKRSYHHVDTQGPTYAVKTTFLSVSDEEVLYCRRYFTIIVMLVFGVLDYSCILDSCMYLYYVCLQKIKKESVGYTSAQQNIPNSIWREHMEIWMFLSLLSSRDTLNSLFKVTMSKVSALRGCCLH